VHSGRWDALSECDPNGAAGLTGCTPYLDGCEEPQPLSARSGSNLIGVNVYGPRDSDNRMRTHVEPKLMHALIWKQSGGEPWSFLVRARARLACCQRSRTLSARHRRRALAAIASAWD